MAWKASCIVSLREEFVNMARREEANIAQLCRRFGISRKTGYKWIARFAQQGRAALVDRSRRPKSSPRQSSAEMEQAVVLVRQQHPAWGGRKIRRVLLNQGTIMAPAPSTIGRILHRQGWIASEESSKHRAFVRFEKAHPNELWQMDFKGHVPLLDGGRCHPLTVLDDHSRFNIGLLACADERTETVQAALIKLLERHGQPRCILCDNGAPWGNGGEEPYTKLSVWLLLHGIGVCHGRPYHPQTQGKDERFHRTLEVELISRQSWRDLDQAQGSFDQWRDTYNNSRPHEAIGLATPMTRWRPSPRAYQANPPAPQYLSSDAVRKVDSGGKLSFHGRSHKIGQAFAGQKVALRQSDCDGVMKVLLGEQEIGQLNLRSSASAATCRAEAPVATLPAPRHGTEESVTHVSEHVLPLTPI